VYDKFVEFMPYRELDWMFYKVRHNFKCRVDTGIDKTSVTEDPSIEPLVIVFLKTSEEAKCSESDCAWQYTATLPTVTEMTTEFDADTGVWLVKVVGEGMRDSAEAGEMSDLQINSVSQTVRSHSDTMAVFEVIDA